MMKEKKTQVISIVGAGGKTSLLYTLAEMLLRGDGGLRLFGLEPVQKTAGCPGDPEAGGPGGPRVLVTTSTKILVPEHCSWCADAAAVRKEWEAGRYAVAGTLTELWPEDSGGISEKGSDPPDLRSVKKLSALPEKEFQKLRAEADVILIEADGAKHLPLKLPAEHEPVIRPETTLVLGVAGLSAVGKPFRGVCFRAELLPAFLKALPEEEASALHPRPGRGAAEQDERNEWMVTEELAAAILASDRGIRKDVGNLPYLAVLNQCTTPEREKAGREILKLLKEKYQINGVLTALSAPAGKKDRRQERE